MKYKPYSKYKESRVEWLAMVPEHWIVKKIKWDSAVFRGASPRPIDDPIFFDDEGEYAWVRISDVTASNEYLEATEQRLSEVGASLSVKLNPGSLFLSIAATVGKPCITQIKCCIHDGFVWFPYLKANPKFLYYIFACGESYKGLGKFGTQLNLNTETVGSIHIAFPPDVEQNLIVSFLDHETSRIDTLIEKKQELIKLLQEKRTALIHNAVTKGLNPNVKLKDSEIEWLGMLPEYWEIKKLKYVSKGVQTGITPPTDREEYFEDGVNWFTPADFSTNLLLNDSKRKLSKLAFEDGVAKLFPANSVFFVGIGATLGKVGYIDKPASSNQQINAIYFETLEKAKYYSYYLLINQPNIVALANASTLAILNQTQTKDIPVIVPDYNELKLLVSYLDTETTKIDNLITEVEKAIIKLQEYRIAVITAAVTGKINVSE